MCTCSYESLAGSIFFSCKKIIKWSKCNIRQVSCLTHTAHHMPKHTHGMHVCKHIQQKACIHIYTTHAHTYIRTHKILTLELTSFYWCLTSQWRILYRLDHVKLKYWSQQVNNCRNPSFRQVSAVCWEQVELSERSGTPSCKHQLSIIQISRCRDISLNILYLHSFWMG